MFKKEKKSDNQNGLIWYTNVQYLRIAIGLQFIKVERRPCPVHIPVAQLLRNGSV